MKLKRDDIRYTEIEKFEDYELTNCIAYEMCIRNKEFIKLSNEWSLKFERFNTLSHLQREALQRENNSIQEKFGLSPNIQSQILERELALDEHGRVFISHKTLNNGKSQYKGDSTPQSFLTRSNGIEGLNEEFQNEAYIRLSRPKLNFSSITEINIQLNMTLPKEELKAYVMKIINELDTPTVTLKQVSTYSEDIELHKINSRASLSNESEGKKLQERWADYFFVYDYYQYRQNEQKRNNLKLSISHKRELTQVKQKEWFKNLDKFDKQDYLSECKNTHRSNLETVDTIQNEIQESLKLPSLTRARDMQSYMNKMINSLQYLNLIKRH